MDIVNEEVPVPPAEHDELVHVRRAHEATALKLAESQGLLTAVLDNTNNGIFLVGPDLTILFMNRRMGEMFGIDTRDVIGRNKRELVTDQIMSKMSDPQAFVDRLFYLYENFDEVSVDPVAVKSPVERFLERYSTPVYREDGELLGRLEVYSDVTEVRQLQRNKDEFLSLVSHELRTPVTSIKGYAQLLLRRAIKEGPAPSTIAAYESIERQATRMQNLIDLLLDMSRMESGRLHLDVSTLDFSGLVTRAVETVQMTTEDHTAVVRCPAESLIIVGDEARLEQVIMNLMTNAVRYSPDGGEIDVTIKDLGDRVSVEVADHGTGIGPDSLPHIFDRFYRDPATRQSSGMGIGLYITRTIVELHGGSISVQSTLGRGSTFEVTLPRDNQGTRSGYATSE